MKPLALFALVLPLCAFAQTAKIKVDIDQAIDAVDPRIYGVFMEPIGRAAAHYHTLYGPVYDPKSPLADRYGFRGDIIAAARELQLTQMRWPGGNFTSTYDWRDGIGPKDQRPRRQELAWGVVESNQVGTDEWVELNQEIGSENVVCINAGTGTLDEARFWVEYCNAPAGTYWADQRVANGHPAPYGIRLWDLGNEVDGSPWILAHKDADDYVKFALEAAKMMRRASPIPLQFVACGASWYQPNLDWVDWNEKVIRGLSGVADYLSVHLYWEPSNDYEAQMGQRAMDLEGKIEIVAGQIRTVAEVLQRKPMRISFDEWAPRGRRGPLATLAVAQFFNAFLRHADVVKMANYTLLTSLLGREPGSDQTFKTPLFYTFQLFSTHCRGTALRTFVDCGTFASGYYSRIPYLDVSSVYDPQSRQVVVNVVNRSKDQAIAADLQSVNGSFAGPATVSTIASDGVADQAYTYAARASYAPKVAQAPAQGPTFHWEFPAHSFTQIAVGIAR